MIMQKTDFLGIKYRKQKGKPHNLFSTNSIPSTAVVISLKHKLHHSSVQSSLSKSQSPYKWPRKTFAGLSPSSLFVPICCDSPTFCLSSRHAGLVVAGLDIIIFSHLRAFELADPYTWILSPNIHVTASSPNVTSSMWPSQTSLFKITNSHLMPHLPVCLFCSLLCI